MSKEVLLMQGPTTHVTSYKTESHTHRFTWMQEIDSFKCEECGEIITREGILYMKEFLDRLPKR